MINQFINYVGKNFGNPNGIGGKISTLIMNILNQKQYEAVLKNIKLEPNNTVLDIGFGNGYLLNKLLKQNIKINIYGIEISKDMFTRVMKKYGKNSIKLYLENINKTSFVENTFDKICTVNTIYFWNELDKCFAEIKRILKPNGIFLNVIYTKEFMDKLIFTKYGFQKYAIENIIEITENNGMRIVETIEIQKNKSYCVISENIKLLTTYAPAAP
jgi:ubiquinone/menaquinone biosynthesis C-methylase UbiE